MLRVGTYKGVKGKFKSIQAAVNKARPGDWILVGPGDYHERNQTASPALPQRAAHRLPGS